MDEKKNWFSRFVISDELYNAAKGEMAGENKHNLAIFSFLSLIIFAALFLSSNIIPTITHLKYVYFGYGIFSAAIFFASHFINESRITVISILVYIFEFVLFTFGILLGTVYNTDNLTVSFIVLLLSIPMLFNTRPQIVNTVILFSIVIYIFLASRLQNTDSFTGNMINVSTYGSLSMVVTAYLMKVKVSRFVYKKEKADIEEKEKINTKLKTEYESFINEMIRYSSSQEEPDEIINQLLKYIGEKLQSDRAYIFEDNKDGTYNNTYEWCRTGVSKEIDNLQNVPFKGLLDTWIYQFDNSNNILIYDLEEYGKNHESLYKVLKPQGINSLVTGPLKIDGKVIGFYGVDNPPVSAMENISELINMMEFMVTFILRIRNAHIAIEENAVHDQLTNCKNRKALTWAYSGNYNVEKPMAVFMFDMNGLKKVNDTQGHDAGDRFICRFGETLSDIFEKDKVYRMGGDEFMVVLPEITKDQLNEYENTCQIQIGTSACWGTAFVEKMDADFSDLMKIADKELYIAKDKFYQDLRKK